MSIRLMSAIFDSKTLGPTERLVMLALADHADDEGKCYPSVLRLCARTGLSERAVQTNVKKLTEAGYLSVHIGGGKGHANLYFLSANPAADALYNNPKPRTICTPQEMHPAAGAPQTPQQVRPNPAADAPEPSGTINEPSEEPPLVPPVEIDKPEPKARLPDEWALSDEGWAYARSQKIPDEVITDEARGFHAYWSDRADRDAKKSERGWDQCWAGWCRRIASRYQPRVGMAGKAGTGGYGQGGSIASIAARRRATGQV